MDQSSSDFLRGMREESPVKASLSDFGYLVPFGDIRDRSLKLSEIAPNFACFWPPISLGGGPPDFFDLHYKLEIWGRAQRKAARGVR